MGNTIEPEVRDEMVEVINNIFQIEFPTLDIGKRQGNTGYIDFIQPEELGNLSIMKGRDYFGREFIVFKSKLTTKNNNPVEYFTTFFKRYTDESNTIYHTAAHDGNYLFATEGGITLYQLNFLYELLKKGSVDITYEDLRKNRVRVNIDYLTYNNEEEEKKEEEEKSEEEKWELIKNMVGKITIS